jgi:hypothetical protein
MKGVYKIIMNSLFKRILITGSFIVLIATSTTFATSNGILYKTYQLLHNQKKLTTESLIYNGEVYINLTNLMSILDLSYHISSDTITMSKSLPTSNTYIDNNGNFYSGSLLNGVPHGQGTQYLKNGGKYEGYWENGLYEGQGTLILENGSMYTGAFSKGFIHGEGKMIYPDASYYKGNYVYGIREGFGLLYIDKDNKYEGYWENGFRNGKGKAYIEGSYKKGLWENNKLIKRLSESDFNF